MNFNFSRRMFALRFASVLSALGVTAAVRKNGRLNLTPAWSWRK